MPKFVEQIIENLDTDADIENLHWTNVAIEIPDFPDLFEEEILIPDAFVFDNIETM